MPSSTPPFMSISTNFNSSGLDLKIKLVKIVLIHTDLPEPVAPAVVPAQPAQTQITTPQSNSSDGQIVNIGGKNYLIHDGKAYPVQ